MRHVIVDGSNIATEGRTKPSFKQLEEALADFRQEYPGTDLTVVVDASFGHRVNPSERALFEEAELKGEVVSPPAGAIGRGDAFLLRIAEKTGASVLSNDSFQEFHGEHDWLFSDGRLIGGKPVRGVGWIFTPRAPVRGARSKVATSKARATAAKATVAKAGTAKAGTAKAGTAKAGTAKSGTAKAGTAKAGARASKLSSGPAPVPTSPPPRKRAAPRKVQQAIAAATAEAVSPGGSRRRRGSGPPAESVNDSLTFITFIADHPLGSRVQGVVERFTSHGAFARVNGALCYVPLSGLGNPPPRRAREVLSKGESRAFVVQALDAPRRGVELALPRVATVRGEPSEETVTADIAGAARKARVPARARGGAPARGKPEAARDGTAARAGTAKAAAAKPASAKPAGSVQRRARVAKAPSPRAKAASGKVPSGSGTSRKAKPAKATRSAKASAAKAPASKGSRKASAGRAARGGRPAEGPPARAAAARAPKKARASKKRSSGKSARAAPSGGTSSSGAKTTSGAKSGGGRARSRARR
jgi:hypothetical protein